MKDNKAIAQDLGIELAGASIVALIVWLATLTSGTVGIPTPAVILIAGLATLAVAFLVSNVVRGRHVRRVETEMRGMREASRHDRERFRRIRDEIRTIGEQLMVGDQQTTLKAITTYTVDPAGQDRVYGMICGQTGETTWN